MIDRAPYREALRYTLPTMQPGRRVRLSVGPSMPFKLLGSVVALALVGGAVAFLLVAFVIGNQASALGSSFDPGGSNPDLPGVDNTAGFISSAFGLFGLCGIPFVLFGLGFLLQLWRVGAWLDGTEVSYRNALWTRRADLATASVMMSGITYVHHHNDVGPFDRRTVIRVPALAVTAPGRRPFKIPLRGQGLDLLPPDQLRALSDALLANTGPESARARAVGDHLRKLADDPLVY
jgi:hypothetical protein